jgi:hypothetical protein
VARIKDFGVAALACPDCSHVGLRVTMTRGRGLRKSRVACEVCPWNISPAQPGQAHDYLHAVGRAPDGRRVRQ